MRYVRIAAAAVAALGTVTLAAQPATAQTLPELVLLDVAPITGAAGTTFTITGEDCLLDGAPGVTALLVGPEDPESDDEIDELIVEDVADDGTWSVDFEPATDAGTGDYVAAGACFGDLESETPIVVYLGEFELTAPATTTTTTTTSSSTTTTTAPLPVAPPATPVDGDPNFTG